MSDYHIDLLEAHCPQLVDSCAELLFKAFAKPERYSIQRLGDELRADSPPFYRKFFVAFEAGVVIGIGGVKAADWASNTHLLYLSAVTPNRRGRGIGRELIKTRIAWVEENFKSGQLLVSSAKGKRFRELGFTPIRKTKLDGRQLLIRRF